jgi:MATE family multidrug resistance protein
MFAYVFNNVKESKASDYLCRLKKEVVVNLKQYDKEF